MFTDSPCRIRKETTDRTMGSPAEDEESARPSENSPVPTHLPLPESRNSLESVQEPISEVSPRNSAGSHSSSTTTQSTNEISVQVANLLCNVAPRGPVYDYSLRFSANDSRMTELRGHFRARTSTSDDLMSWLLHQQEDETAGWKHLLPGSAIFNILQNDTMDFFQMVETFLDQVETSLSNETAVRGGLSLWRGRITRISAELRYLERSIPKLAQFLTSTSGRSSPAQGGDIDDEIYGIENHLLPDILSEISLLETRIKASSQNLVSSVSIIESRKGIAEAESISKLTELGSLRQRF